MTNRVLSQASSLGFTCECDQIGNWQILPFRQAERWKLQQVGERWLLLVGDIPQVNLHPPEAIAFLERRSSKLQNSTSR